MKKKKKKRYARLVLHERERIKKNGKREKTDNDNSI